MRGLHFGDELGLLPVVDLQLAAHDQEDELRLRGKDVALLAEPGEHVLLPELVRLEAGEDEVFHDLKRGVEPGLFIGSTHDSTGRGGRAGALIAGN